MIRIFFIMLLLHIVAEFVLQPVCLSRLKRDTTHKDTAEMAIAISAIMWATMIMIPLMYYSTEGDLVLLLVFLANFGLHTMIDGYYTNRQKISFVTTQCLYLMLVAITFLLTMLINIA